MAGLGGRKRQPRGNSREIEQRVLASAIDQVREDGFAANMILPPMEAFLDYLKDIDQTIPRSTMYRLWPNRDLFHIAIVKQLIDGDPYNTEAFETKSLQALINPEIMGDRPTAVATLGKLAVTTTDHQLVSVLEATAAAAHEETDLPGMMIDAQSNYLEVVAASYELLHAKLGDSPVDGLSFDDYARTVAATSRSIGLNPFGLEGTAYDSQFDQFQTIAQTFTAN